MIVSILIGVGAVVFVIGVAIRSYYKRKRGETGCSCGNCAGCKGCSHGKNEEGAKGEQATYSCACRSEQPTDEGTP